MDALQAILLGLSVLLPAEERPVSPPAVADCARLHEILQDRQHPQGQSQAALLLVQNHSREAEEIVRQGLQDLESPEEFLALTAALRLSLDSRFNPELMAALVHGESAIRQPAADLLALLADEELANRLRTLVLNPKTDVAVRQAAIMALGRSGRKQAAGTLIALLGSNQEAIRSAAADSLADLSGQSCGSDAAAWRAWWEGHQDLSDQRWLEERLAYQANHAQRLDGELERARSQLVRLHQQLYTHLPVPERLTEIQNMAEQEDPTLRALAVSWSADLLSTADVPGRPTLTDLLLRLSYDSTPEVQRPAVLALGHVLDRRVFERLQLLVRQGSPSVRVAAARALTQEAAAQGEKEKEKAQEGVVPVSQPPAFSNSATFTVPRAEVVQVLQMALDDPSVEMVVEAAEDLGTLGVPEAGPVLTALLHHSSESVRQTAAQALERLADPTVLDGLLTALDDPAATVRFSLIGALGHAAGQGRPLSEAERARLLSRLEKILVHDPDPGVRSRAATVLGECGTSAVAPILWQRLQAAEEGRVQDKSWEALVRIITRSNSLDLLGEWDHKLAEAKQDQRRVQLLQACADSWKKNGHGALAGAALELLVQEELDRGEWAQALPLIRELLNQPAPQAELEKRLRWLLTAGEQAQKAGNVEESLRVVRDAQPFLARNNQFAADFEKLEKEAKQGR